MFFLQQQYEKKKINVYIENEENSVKAITYIWIDNPNLLHKEDWNSEDFKKQLDKWNANPDILTKI